MVRPLLSLVATGALVWTAVAPLPGADAASPVAGLQAMTPAESGPISPSEALERDPHRVGVTEADGLPPSDASLADAQRDVGTDGLAPADEARANQIAARLRNRHTALPERERIALAYTIVREARAQGLEPDLVVAVIEVESAGYHLAVSHVGAMGLMQLLPSTGEELAHRLKIEWLGPDTLFDPTTNIRLGTAYLRQLANRYDGDVDIALAAYNWGPGRIDRRLRRGASVPSRYVEQVMRAYDRNLDRVSRSS